MMLVRLGEAKNRICMVSVWLTSDPLLLFHQAGAVATSVGVGGLLLLTRGSS